MTSLANIYRHNPLPGRRQAVDKDGKLTKQMSRFSGIRLQRASAAVPDLRMKQKSIDS